LEHLAQPSNLFFVAGTLGAGIMPLVAPVSTYPQLGLLVHLEGAYLNFQHLVLRPEDRGMQRLITVLLWIGDVVVKLVRNVMPPRMHNAKHGVAITHSGHEDANGPNIVDLGKGNSLALHLPPDRIDMLCP